MAVAYQAVGTAVSATTGTLTVAWPAHQVDDVALLFVNSSGGGTTQTLTTAAGFTLLHTATTGTGTAGTKMSVYWARATSSSMASPVVTAGTDYKYGVIVTYRGAAKTGSPIDVDTSSVKAATSTSSTLPAVTTTVANDLIVYALSKDSDSAAAWVTSIANANLTGITERFDAGTISGGGGGIGVYDGYKATAGSTGTATATIVTAITTMHTIAIKPELPAIPIVEWLSQNTEMSEFIPTGSSITSGTDKRVSMSFDVTVSDPTDTVNVFAETEPIATPFNNTSNATFGAGTNPVSLGATNYPAVPFRSHSLTYDSVRDRFILYGGWNGTTNTGEVWEISADLQGSPNKATWKKLNPTGTPPANRRLHGSVFDSVNNRLIVFGGYTTADTNTLHSLSFSSSADGVWSTLTPTGTAPAARSNITESMTINRTTNIAYLYGGWGASHYNDLFALNLNSTQPAWTTLKANGAAGNPIGRRDHVMDFDHANGRLIMTCGYTGTAYLNDTWEYKLSTNTWTQLTSSLSDTLPNIRSLLIGQIDEVNQRLIITNGYQGALANLQRDIWAFDLSAANTKWTELTPASNMELPHPTYASASAYDHNNNLILYNGGLDSTNDQQRCNYVIDCRSKTNDGVVFGLEMQNWKRAQDAAGVICIDAYDEVLSIGGLGNMTDDTDPVKGEHMNDIYVAKRNETPLTWRKAVRGMLTMHHREGALVAWDSTRERALVFGGLKGIDNQFNDLWSFTRGSDGLYTPKRLNPTGTRPSQRWLGAATYDSVNDRFIIFSGESGASTVTTDTWVCSFASSPDGVWSQVTPTGSTPTPGWGFGYVTDPYTNELYLCGGSTTGTDSAYSSQIKKLNNSTLVWTDMGTLQTAGRSMNMSANDNLVVIHGGGTASAVQGNFQYLRKGTDATFQTIALTNSASTARRSHIGWLTKNASNQNVYRVTDGRPVSGIWPTDAWEVTFTAYPTMTGTWSTFAFNRAFRYRLLHMATVGTEGSYHWQAWASGQGGTSNYAQYGGFVDSTYYFDGSLGVEDPNSNWTNDSQAFDGSTVTWANATAASTVSSGFLLGKGTNSPITGNIITGVQVRHYGTTNAGETNSATYYTSGLAQSLGTSVIPASTTGYSPYVTLTVPTGGWTWAKLDTLEVKFYTPAGRNVRRAEILVTAENGVDYIISSANLSLNGMKKVLINGSWTPKPVKYLVNGTWTQKKAKIFNGTSWVDSVQ